MASARREAVVYPNDALIGRDELDVITPVAAPTIDQLFRVRVSRSGARVAITDFDFDADSWCDYTWEQIAAEVSRWQAAMRQQGLRKGDHVGLRLRNCRHWVIFDQAALGLGLVVVPLYVADRADNVNYVLAHANVKLLLVETLSEWAQLQAADGDTPELDWIVVLERCEPREENVYPAHRWLPESPGALAGGFSEPAELASMVFTSGTTGRPKGVMLSHSNMVSNAYAGLSSVAVGADDVLLSFLPLSHTLEQNKPSSIGLPLHGVSVRIGDNDELLVQGPNVMMGYWCDDETTNETLVDDWLYSGDQARIDEDGFLFITGRIKDILVLANGEKLAPADMESAIAADPLFEQMMVIGEQMPYLTALVVLNKSRWRCLAKSHGIDADNGRHLSAEPVEHLSLAHIRAQIQAFPGYARIRRVTAMLEPWTVEDGLITPTLKLKRAVVRQRFELDIARMYEGHDTFKTELRRHT